MAVPKLATSWGFQSIVAGNSFLLGQAAWHYRPQCIRTSPRSYATQTSPKPGGPAQTSSSASSQASSTDSSKQQSPSPSSDQSLPPGWEDDAADLDISKFSQLPHRHFGTNQHIKVNESFKESLRQVLWQFRAPIRYAFAYGSGVFSQGSSTGIPNLTPHPHPPEAVTKWQDGGGKIIDFIFGVSHTQHWHSLNLTQNRNHYSALGYLGSYPVSQIQDNLGAGVYFNPYITVNGIMIKYGVVSLDTICKDLSEWDTLYLAGRLQKPVKILRDDPKVRLANQINLVSAVRTALLMLPEKFSEMELYEKIAGISYLGDPRMNAYVGGENPRKVSNIVKNQLPNFRQLYVPLVDNLPNVNFNDAHVPQGSDWAKEQAIANAGTSAAAPGELLGGPNGFMMQQDMDPVRRGNMVRRLPKKFRQKLYFQYHKKFGMPSSEFNEVISKSLDEDATSFRRRQGGEFEQRIGKQDDLSNIVGRCIRNTISWPSTSQSIKGIFTAGLGRSWKYYSEKRNKSRDGKSQAADKSAELKSGKEA